tara:strand:- start:46938 stop:47588 length:651 start_codon:yes stop_codon:yes gene_type:complete
MSNSQYSYTSLLLHRDKARSSHVYALQEQMGKDKLSISSALDSRNSHDMKEIYDLLHKFGIRIWKNIDPNFAKDQKTKRFYKAKLSVYGSYIKTLLNYEKSDFIIILQDDAYFKDHVDAIKTIPETYNENSLSLIKSSRMGQYMSGCIFRRDFIEDLLKELQRTGIYRPMDHYLLGPEVSCGIPSGVDKKSMKQLMLRMGEKFVEVKNFRSNIIQY